MTKVEERRNKKTHNMSRWQTSAYRCQNVRNLLKECSAYKERVYQ